MKPINLALSGISLLFSLSCFSMATQTVNTINEETIAMTKATKGTQVAINAPLPSAIPLFSLGTVTGISSLFLLYRGLDFNDDGQDTEETDNDEYSSDFSSEQFHRVDVSLSKRPVVKGGLMGSQLRDIVGAGFLSIIGDSGGGKSSLVAAVIRERIKLGHRVIVTNPQRRYGEYEPLEWYGRGKTLDDRFMDIKVGLDAMMALCNERYNTMLEKPEPWDFENDKVTLVVEELGLYRGRFEDGYLQNFIKEAVTAYRKANIFVILVSQSNTSEMFGGTKGLAEPLKAGATTVQLLAKPDPNVPGGLKATGYCMFNLPRQKPTKVKVPSLMELFGKEKNYMDFTDLFGTVPSEGEVDDILTAPPDISMLERVYATTATLTEQQDKVLRYAQSEGVPVSARNVALKSFSVLKGLSADDIRAIFNELSARGFGTVENGCFSALDT